MSEDSLSPTPPIPASTPPPDLPPSAAPAAPPAEAKAPSSEENSSSVPEGPLPPKKRPRHRGGRNRKKHRPGLSPSDEAEDDDEAPGDTNDAEEAGNVEPSSASQDAPTGAEGAPSAPPRPPQPKREPRPDRPPRPPRPDNRPPQRSDIRPPRHERSERLPLDPRELSDKAWQLFFGELREEGLALVDEADAERLSVRCFKLAETFLRTRHRRFSQPTIIVSGAPDDRRNEPRPAPPPRPEPVIPIEKRLPDDPSTLSKEQAEALIEEAQEVAESRSAQPTPGPEEPTAATPPVEPAQPAKAPLAPEAAAPTTEAPKEASVETPSPEATAAPAEPEPAPPPPAEASAEPVASAPAAEPPAAEKGA